MAAATTIKLQYFTTLLILYGMVVLLGQTTGSEAKVCPLFCLKVAYMTCPSSGTKPLAGSCNCCLTPNSKGCTLHLSGGSTISCP